MTLSAALRPGSRKLLVPYVTGGITADWTDYLLAYQEAGADAIEVGLPFSDPMLDGPTIQEAAQLALTRGATPQSVLDDLAAARDHLTVPIAVMTYANLVSPSLCSRLTAAGVSGLIVPDLPLDEVDELSAAAHAAGVDLPLLVAPTTPDDRLLAICSRSQAFVYAVSTMGTTGERRELDVQALTLATRARAATDLPVLIGFGVSIPGQAAQAARASDGVVVGSALMRNILDTASPNQMRTTVAGFRTALDRTCG